MNPQLRDRKTSTAHCPGQAKLYPANKSRILNGICQWAQTRGQEPAEQKKPAPRTLVRLHHVPTAKGLVPLVVSSPGALEQYPPLATMSDLLELLLLLHIHYLPDARNPRKTPAVFIPPHPNTGDCPARSRNERFSWVYH